MEKNSTNFTTAEFEVNGTQFPACTESERSISASTDHNEVENTSIKKGLPFYVVIIGMLLIMLVMNVIEMHQYQEYCATVEQEAYVLSVGINLLEDNLLFGYGFTPQDLGLGELRKAWISNACYETAMPYYEALKEVWDYFEGFSEQSYTYDPVML